MTVAGNAVWCELCGLLHVEDEAIVDAGRTENAKLLLLRANLKEEDMAMVETLLEDVYRAGLDEESEQKVDKLLAAKDLEVAQRLAAVNKIVGEKCAVIDKQAGRLVHGWTS